MRKKNRVASITDYSAIIALSPITSPLRTELLFNRATAIRDSSPIDEFIENINNLNLFWANLDKDLPVTIASAIFMGYFSAVEGYIRALIRNLVSVDVYSLKSVEQKNITFGAALHHNKNLLPESLMDEFSFISSVNIITTFKELISIDLVLDDLTRNEFDKICQMRHCAVHRFGKLGAKNAICLGLQEHQKLFEKPLELKNNDLAAISSILRSFVGAVNNSIYKAILDRTFPVIPTGKKESKKVGPSLWRNNYKDDRKLFYKYYSTFSSKIEGSPPAKEMYTVFIKQKNYELARNTAPKQ